MEKFPNNNTENTSFTQENPQLIAKEQTQDLKKSMEEMKTITNRDFLSLKKEDRLQYVTQKSIDYQKIRSGEVTEIKFFFDQDGSGKDDSDLYRLTTAGQVFGTDVGELIVDGVAYKRDGLDGEFFNNGKRLKIHTNTVATISKLRTENEKQELLIVINNGLEKYKQYENKTLLRGLLERNMPVESMYKILNKGLANIDVLKRGIKIEELLTQIDRFRDKYQLAKNDKKLVDYMSSFNGKNKVFGLETSTYQGEYLVGHEHYKDIVDEVSSKYSKISASELTTLINRENAKWDPRVKAPGEKNTAYGLGQMINDTWITYGEGLDRNNPRDQLEATCKYLTAIMERQKCGIELAMAYYNTGEGVLKVSDKSFNNYLKYNTPIVSLIKGAHTRENYLIAAIAYYNNKTFNESEQIFKKQTYTV